MNHDIHLAMVQAVLILSIPTLLISVIPASIPIGSCYVLCTVNSTDAKKHIISGPAVGFGFRV